MYPDLKPLDRQVIVITGASSGIGLVTARTAAKAGAGVLLVARNERPCVRSQKPEYGHFVPLGSSATLALLMNTSREGRLKSELIPRDRNRVTRDVCTLAAA